MQESSDNKKYNQKMTITTCKYCNKCFTLKQNLVRHIKQEHINEQKNECRFCKSSFKDKSNLRRHILNIHDKIKYSCTICNKTFSDKSNLLKHYNICRKVFPCVKCKTLYISQDDLNYQIILMTS